MSVWWRREDIDQRMKRSNLSHPNKPPTPFDFVKAVPKASAEYGKFAIDRTVADARGLYQSVVGLTADSVMYRNEDKGTKPNTTVMLHNGNDTRKGNTLPFIS